MSTVTTACAGILRPRGSVASPLTRTVPGSRHVRSGGRFHTTGRAPRVPSRNTGVTVAGSSGRRPGTVNVSAGSVRSTVSSVTVQRWFAAEVGVYVDTLAPSEVDWPVTSMRRPVAALTNVHVPSPVVDMIHCAASETWPRSPSGSVRTAWSSRTASRLPVLAWVSA